MIRKDVIVLINKGRELGFLTQDDILEIFPDAEDRLEELDELYEKLLAEGIDVFESVTTEEVDSDEKAKEKLEREKNSLRQIIVYLVLQKKSLLKSLHLMLKKFSKSYLLSTLLL